MRACPLGSPPPVLSALLPLRLLSLLACVAALATCSDHEARLGSVSQAMPDLPPKPDFPDGTILPTEPVGYLPGGGSVSSSGQAGYSIPLDVPPGRLGIQPELSLSYSSGATNGIVGVGWGITGLGVIARCSHTWASGGKADGIDWDAGDAFCFDGQKLVGGSYDPTDNTKVFRTEHETYAEVRAHLTNGSAAQPSKFVVRTRDRRILTFTPISAERITVDPVDPTVQQHLSQAVVWPLTEVRDRSGNYMSFSYDVSAPTTAPYSFSYLPQSIRYTFSATAPATPAEREVRFVYEDRLPLDQPVNYSAGVRTVLTKRLSAIEMYAPSEPGKERSLAWRYLLAYDYSDSTFRSLLKSVKQCDPLDKCKWARELTWTSEQDAGDLNQIGVVNDPIDMSVQTNLGGPTGFRLPPGGTEVPPQGDPDGDVPVGGLAGVLVGDFDDDGRDDALYWDDYRTEEIFDPTIGDWVKITWDLKLRLSKTATTPLSEEHLVGDAWARIADPLHEDAGKFVGLNLGASRVIDIDGDGAAELFLARDPFGSIDPEYAVHKWNDAAGEFQPVANSSGIWTTRKNVDFVDLNGDGLIDLIESIGDHWKYRLNLGGEFADPAVDTGVIDEGENGNEFPYDECRGAPVAGDFDGDGRGDYLVAGPLASSCKTQVLISLDDAGQVVATTVAMPELVRHYSDPNGIKPKPYRLADVNGDGLDDIVSNATVRLNTGRGFLPVAGDPTAAKHSVLPLDLNGDGRADLVTREGSSSFVDFSMAGAANENAFFGAQIQDTSFARAGDFDGDGAPEFLALADDPDHPKDVNDPQRHQRRLYVRKLGVASTLDLLSEVKDQGASHAREKFTYSRTWNEAPSAQGCAYPKNCIKRGITVVREHAVSQGERLLPSMQRTLYTYDKPLKDVRGRGFLGFGQVTELIDGLYQQQVTVYDNAERVVAANQEFYPRKTRSVTRILPLLEQPATVPTAPPPATTTARITVYSPGLQTVYPTSSSWLTRLATWSSIESESTVNIGPNGVTPLGSPLVIRQRSGENAYSDTIWNNLWTSTASTVGGVTSVSTATYSDIPSQWLLGLVNITTEQVWDADDAQPVTPRTISREYDSAGRMFRITREPNAIDSLWQETEIVYDSLGQPKQSTTRAATGQADRVEYYFYDIEELFVEQTNNAAGHWHTEVFHPALGVPAVVQDANLVISTFNYDAFGRFRAAAPGGGMKVATSYAAYQPVAGVNAGLQVSNTAEDNSASIDRVDELGRTFEQQARAFDGTWAVADTVFNLFGQATSSSRPGAGMPSSYRAQLSYDGLGRVVKSIEPDGATTQIVHTASTTGVTSTSTDPDGDVRAVRTDRDGRLVEKKDRLDNATLVTTTYSYRPFNLIELVTDHLGNKITTGYDSIGRRTSVLDPDAGDTTYEYTGFDDLRKVTNHTGTRTYSCDALGRVYNISDGDGERFFAWDTAANGLGKLGRTESPDQVVVTYSYDPFSRPETTTIAIGVGPAVEQFGTKLSYDPLGRPDILTYPVAPGRAEFAVQNTYNPYGYLQARVDPKDFKNAYWTVTARELDGALKGHKQANLVSSIVHDAATGRVKQFAATNGSTGPQLLSLSYDYYPGGDIRTRSDTVAGRVETFKYDGLNRLTGWSLASTTSAFPTRDTTYAYDLIGNLTKVTVGATVVDTAVYGGPRPHAITSLNGQTFAYDGAGRQYDGPKRTVTFNTFNLPKKVADKVTKLNATYLYDVDQNRVRKTDLDGTVTTYVGDVYERRQKGTTIDHVFMVPGEDGPVVQVAYREGKGDLIYHLSGDLHGSVSLVLNNSMVVQERRYAEPFGGRVNADGSPVVPKSSPITRGFTGHEEESAIGLINMRGRMYDPAQRRFLTPDLFVSQPLFSQSFNRYSYVLNNPLRYTDPSGFQVAQAQTTGLSSQPPPALPGGTWTLRRNDEGGQDWVWVPNPPPQSSDASDEKGQESAGANPAFR